MRSNFKNKRWKTPKEQLNCKNSKLGKKIKRIPISCTDLIVENESGTQIISYSQGLCIAVKLNSTGYAVWKLIDGKRSDLEIAQILDKQDFQFPSNLSKSNILKDVQKFLGSLENEGFVKISSIEDLEKK